MAGIATLVRSFEVQIFSAIIFLLYSSVYLIRCAKYNTNIFLKVRRMY
jgi:hypothetical protein